MKIGSVYAARSSAGRNVAVKVVDLDRVPGSGPTLAEAYLNEVQHLQKLRKRTHHVVHIYDFDFDRNTGRGSFQHYPNNSLYRFILYSLYRYGIGW